MKRDLSLFKFVQKENSEKKINSYFYCLSLVYTNINESHLPGFIQNVLLRKVNTQHFLINQHIPGILDKLGKIRWNKTKVICADLLDFDCD